MITFAKYFTAILLTLSVSYSGATPTYTLYARDFHFFTNSLTFGIYVTNAHPDSIPEIRYWGGQYFLTFNTLFANGGTLTYTKIGSELPPELQPINPTVFQNQLRLATNLPSLSNSAIVSTEFPGTLIVRMSLNNTVPWATNQSLELKWKNSPPPPMTRLSLSYGNNIPIPTDTNFHFVDLPLTFITHGSNDIPSMFKLYQNYPNPFNPQTKLKFDVPSDVRGQKSDVNLTVYNSPGEEVKTLVNEKFPPGSYEIDFDGNNLAGGIYFCTMKAGEFIETRKLILLK